MASTNKNAAFDVAARQWFRQMKATEAIARCIALLSLAAVTAGCEDRFPLTAVPALPPPAAAPQLYRPVVESEYHIQVGDGLSIQSYFNSNLNQDVTVRPDGKVSLVLLHDVVVAGKTPAQFTAELGERYGQLNYLNKPDINVVVKELASQDVFVDGQVKVPSMVALKGSLTLLQGLASVGGVLTSANTSQILLIRRQPSGEAKVYQFNLDKVLTNKVPDVYLHRYDIVYVPRSDIAEAGLFVQQYINQMLPSSVQNQFSYTLPLGTTRIENR